MPNSLAKLTESVFADALALFGLPTSTAATVFQNFMRRRADEARDILFEEISSGRIDTLEAASEDDAVAIVYRYFLAARDGAARRNLRLLARAIVGLAQRDRLYADDFNRYANTLATLTRDEIFVIAALHRHTKVYEVEIEKGDENAPAPFAQLVQRMVPNLFPTEAALESVCAGAMRTGMLLMGRTFKTTGTYLTSPLVDEIQKLVSFQDALRDEMQGSGQ